MEKSTRNIAQGYGYAVCLVAVITFLIAVTGLITAIIDLGDPLHSGFSFREAPSLASFENYKLDVMRSYPKGTEAGKESYVPTDEELKVMYEAARNDKIQSSNHESNKSILINSFLIVICVVLFFAHWNWMGKLAKAV